jgi:hypothetical protein
MVAVLKVEFWSLGYALTFSCYFAVFAVGMLIPTLFFHSCSNGARDALVKVCENMPFTEQNMGYHRHFKLYLRDMDLDLRVCGLTIRPCTAWQLPVACAISAVGTRTLF